MLVDDILDPGRTSQDVTYSDKHPWEVVNILDEPRRALPTIVSFPGSHSYRDDRHLPQGKLGPGLIWASTPEGPVLEEPNSSERARAMGYDPASLTGPGISEADKRLVLGRCIDQSALRMLMRCYRDASAGSAPSPSSARGGVAYGISAHKEDQLFSSWPGVKLMTVTMAKDQHSSDTLATSSSSKMLQDSVRRHGADAAARLRVSWKEPVVERDQDKSSGSMDAWQDDNLLLYLRNNTLPEELTAEERTRITKRAQRYYIIGERLYYIFTDGSTRLVPKPGDRQELITKTHQLTGHFGINRTTQLLATTHWWYGMLKDVTAVVKHCEHCHRVRSSFDQPSEQLRPLPIAGLFYRWGVDLTGPLPITTTGSIYAMIMIEHYSKHLIVVGIPNKEPHTTRAAFLTLVIGRYGSCAEVVTDGGREFEGEFDALLTQLYIDHRVTQPNNPKADGLAERAVQTVKQALKKLN